MRWFWVACLMAGSAVGQEAKVVKIPILDPMPLTTDSVWLAADGWLRLNLHGNAYRLMPEAEKIDCPVRAEAEMVPRWRDCMPNESSTNGQCFDMIPALKSEPREIPATSAGREWKSPNWEDVYSCPSQGSWIQENSTDGKPWCRKIKQ
ncbi:MAG TPA: hypothetical protein VN861_03525 [Candidatus Acidoferrales bacterium]|nr:hypothetical protein [Candidatus Acidoferrales bacterium]